MKLILFDKCTIRIVKSDALLHSSYVKSVSGTLGLLFRLELKNTEYKNVKRSDSAMCFTIFKHR